MKTKYQSKNNQASNPQSDPQQKRSVLWIGVIMFISGWVFFLGVIVGRGTAPALFDYNKIETEITMLAKTFTDSRKAQNDKETEILASQIGLEYPEELKKKTDDADKVLIPALENQLKPMETPKPVKQTPGPENPVKPAETPKPAPQTPAPENPIRLAEMPKPVPHVPATENPVRPAETPKTAQAPPPPAKSDFHAAERPEAIEHAPDAIVPGPEVKIKSVYDLKRSTQARESAQEKTAPPAPDRAPAAAPKPQPPAPEIKAATAQPVTVQMSSLLDRKSADDLIASLRSKGISASKAPKMVAGKGIWYLVVIGKYASSTEADAMLSRLRQENVDASLVKQ